MNGIAEEVLLIQCLSQAQGCCIAKVIFWVITKGEEKKKNKSTSFGKTTTKPPHGGQSLLISLSTQSTKIKKKKSISNWKWNETDIWWDS